MEKKITHLLYFLCGICMAPLAFYLWKFHSFPFSSRTGDWSNFGSYIGGTIGPLLSAVSILFILKTIYSSNKQHSEQMEFSRNEKIYSQIKEMSDTLHLSLSNNFMFNSSDGKIQPLAYVICNRIERMSSFPTESSTELIPNEEIARSAVRDSGNNLRNEIMLIIKIISLLNQLNSNDSDVYKALFETKISEFQRTVLYSFACKDLADQARYIHTQWPTFRGNLFRTEN